MNRSALDAVIRRSVLTKSQRNVLRFLLALQAKHNGAPLFPSVYKTAEKLGLTHSTVRIALARLAELKVLKLVGAEAGGSTPRVYTLSEKGVSSLPKKAAHPTEISGVKRSSLNSVPPTPLNSVGITREDVPQEKTARVLTLPLRGIQ